MGNGALAVYKPFSKKMINLAGRVFGSLTVEQYVGVNYRGKSVWECRCVCGASRTYSAQHLSAGNVLTCGDGEPHYQRLYPHAAFSKLQDNCVPEPNSGCWLWEGDIGKGGYGVFHWGARRIKAHRVSYEAVHGYISIGMIVRHKCDVRCCVNPDHLEIGTHQDNSTDMVKRGRAARGERNAKASITDAGVLSMKIDLASGMPQFKAAEKYKVSTNVVSEIYRDVKWRHIPWPEGWR